MTSPTQKTLQYLRKSGYVCQVVEHWVAMRGFGQAPGAGIRRDLFGFVDILALLDGQTLAIQCTTKSQISNRLRKIRGTLPMPEDPDEREKLENQNAAIERALHEMWKARWTVAVFGWEKGAKAPVIRYITEDEDERTKSKETAQRGKSSGDDIRPTPIGDLFHGSPAES